MSKSSKERPCPRCGMKVEWRGDPMQPVPHGRVDQKPDGDHQIECAPRMSAIEQQLKALGLAG